MKKVKHQDAFYNSHDTLNKIILLIEEVLEGDDEKNRSKIAKHKDKLKKALAYAHILREMHLTTGAKLAELYPLYVRFISCPEAELPGIAKTKTEMIL